MELQNRFEALETKYSVDEDFRRVAIVVEDVGIGFCRNRHTDRKSKLSDELHILMRERRENKQPTTDSRWTLTKHIRGKWYGGIPDVPIHDSLGRQWNKTKVPKYS